jgi:hypothetical protein
MQTPALCQPNMRGKNNGGAIKGPTLKILELSALFPQQLFSLAFPNRGR